MPAALPIRRVVLYKHGVGYFERRGHVQGSQQLHLDFKARDMNDVLKSMTVLDLAGGTVSAISYDSTKPLEKLLEEATIRLPDTGSLTALLGQMKGARVRTRFGAERVEGSIVGLETLPRAEGEAVIHRPYLTLLVGDTLRSFDVLEVSELSFLDDAVRRDLEFYLATVLSSYKKDVKRLSILTSGEGERELFVSYVLEAPVWKTSYRILLEEGETPLLQGWAVVDNTGDDDWEDVTLSLVAGLPVSFVHDLYSPRYLKRPVVQVQTEAAVAPVIPEEAMEMAVAEPMDDEVMMEEASVRMMAAPAPRAAMMKGAARREALERTASVQTVTQEVGDLFEYRVDKPVTVRRNQSALVPILFSKFEGQRVLLYNRATREKNPMACIELHNTTGLTLEGGPVTVSEGDTYVGEAMLDTMKPADKRFVPYAVELACRVSMEHVAESTPVFRAMLARGVLTTVYYNLRRARYTVSNKAPRGQVLYVEHPRNGGWELTDTLDPAETTDNFWRFKLELEPSKSLDFTVTERTQGYHTYHLTGVSDDQVRAFLASGFIDEPTAAVLREVIALRVRASDLEQQEKRLEQERSQLFKDQERIRANIESLKDSPTQRGLAERFVTKLNEQEDRLEVIAQELERLARERLKNNEEVTSKLQGLAFSTNLGNPERR
jgi:hypothetical protein